MQIFGGPGSCRFSSTTTATAVFIICASNLHDKEYESVYHLQIDQWQTGKCMPGLNSGRVQISWLSAGVFALHPSDAGQRRIWLCGWPSRKAKPACLSWRSSFSYWAVRWTDLQTHYRVLVHDFDLKTWEAILISIMRCGSLWGVPLDVLISPQMPRLFHVRQDKIAIWAVAEPFLQGWAVESQSIMIAVILLVGGCWQR